MGTVFNAKKWKGACAKGKKVCGLVKNGVLFFKSDNYTPPISKNYRRRITIGDNLRNKKIYADFPNDYVLELQDRLGTSFKTNTLVNATNGLITEYTFPSMSGIGTEYYVACNFASDSSDNRFYWCSSSNTDNYVNNSEVLSENDKDYNVTKIDDTNPSYRHLFIEDENIRPLEVGDKLVNGTKLYFNFPDNYGIFLKNAKESEFYRITGKDDFGYIIYSWASDVSIYYASLSAKNIFKYDTNNPSVSTTNISSYICSYNNPIIVGNITGDTSKNYVLVDKTTLG